VPELPEVETTRRGLEPYLNGRHIEKIVIRDRRLRWPIAGDLEKHACGSLIHSIGRRGKYLLLQCDDGWIIMHLGMSGRLRVLPQAVAPSKHDHFDLVLSSGAVVRYTDARRFGALLWTSEDPAQHPLLCNLAPEPLEDAFDAQWLHARLRGRDTPIKLAIMNNEIVTGVGNIYANEALFRARIHPRTRAGRLSMQRCENLVRAIRQTLLDAIGAGGSSLRDFFGADGSPGYFQQNYAVYARQDEPCRVCGAPIRSGRLGQRSTFYCTRCQH
jgi:formamidopyrimidine-DNA glycosylase